MRKNPSTITWIFGFLVELLPLLVSSGSQLFCFQSFGFWVQSSLWWPGWFRFWQSLNAWTGQIYPIDILSFCGFSRIKFNLFLKNLFWDRKNFHKPSFYLLVSLALFLLHLIFISFVLENSSCLTKALRLSEITMVTQKGLGYDVPKSFNSRKTLVFLYQRLEPNCFWE